MTADDKLVVLHGPSHKGISNVQTADFEQVRAKKGFDRLRDMILAGETWEVK